MKNYRIEKRCGERMEEAERVNNCRNERYDGTGEKGGA
jgi:hypothetical protein